MVLQVQQGVGKMPEAGDAAEGQPEGLRLQLRQGPGHGRLHRKN